MKITDHKSQETEVEPAHTNGPAQLALLLGELLMQVLGMIWILALRDPLLAPKCLGPVASPRVLKTDQVTPTSIIDNKMTESV